MVLLMKRLLVLFHGQQFKVLPFLLIAITLGWNYVIGQELLKPSWEAAFPAIVLCGICGSALVALATGDLNRELSAAAKSDTVELLGPTGRDRIVLLRKVSPAPARAIGGFFVALILLLEGVAFKAAFPAVPNLPIAPVAKYPPPELNKPIITKPHGGSKRTFRRYVPVTFSDVTHFTPERRKRIDSEVNAFFEYLNDLGIQHLPDAYPPLQADPVAGEVSGGFGEPFYKWHIHVAAAHLDDPADVIEMYGTFAFLLMLPGVEDGALTPPNKQRAATIFSQYFACSYLRHCRPYAGEDSWAAALWGVRSAFGQTFTDLSVAYTVLRAFDSKQRAVGPFDNWFGYHFLGGVSEVDSYLSRQVAVTEALRKSGIVIPEFLPAPPPR